MLLGQAVHVSSANTKQYPNLCYPEGSVEEKHIRQCEANAKALFPDI